MNWQFSIYNRKTWSILFLIISIICGLVAFFWSKTIPTFTPEEKSRNKNLVIAFFVFLIVAMVMNPELLHILDIFRGFRL